MINKDENLFEDKNNDIEDEKSSNDKENEIKTESTPFDVDDEKYENDDIIENSTNLENIVINDIVEKSSNESFFVENTETLNLKQEKNKNNLKILLWGIVIALLPIFVVIGLLFIFKGYGEKVLEPKTNIIKELSSIQKDDMDDVDNVIEEEKELEKDNDEIKNKKQPIVQSTNVADDYVEDITTLPDMVENVMPAMVSITTTGVISYYNPYYYGSIEEFETESSGSGIIISQDEDELLILTNEHVINAAEEVMIGFIDGTSVEGSVKSYDIETDLAIVIVKNEDISNETLKQIKVATIGDSENLRLGETVVAIGNSLGYGQSVTKGIISALDREIETEDGITRTFIQTDAPINPGNSGGALLNMKGEVIGINESKIASSEIEGVGFAISISSAIDVIEDLKNREYREILDDDEHGWLGITCRDVTIDVTELYNIPSGVFVYDVAKNSSADNAGIVSGDVITSFDGVKITSSDVLVDMIKRYEIGETVEVILWHYENGEYIEKTIELTLLAKQYE